MQKFSGLFDAVDRELARLARFCTFISGFCLVTLVVTFGWLVYGRYILNSTPTWVEQLSLLLVVTITFLSAAVGIREQTHLSVEILPNMLSPTQRSKLYVLIDIILAVFGLVMAKQSYLLMQFTWPQQIPLLDISEGFRTAPVAACGVLITLFSLGNILQELRSGSHDLNTDFAEDARLMGADSQPEDLT